MDRQNILHRFNCEVRQKSEQWRKTTWNEGNRSKSLGCVHCGHLCEAWGEWGNEKAVYWKGVPQAEEKQVQASLCPRTRVCMLVLSHEERKREERRAGELLKRSSWRKCEHLNFPSEECENCWKVGENWLGFHFGPIVLAPFLYLDWEDTGGSPGTETIEISSVEERDSESKWEAV